jgi:FMN-dependent NADH-azoreductase
MNLLHLDSSPRAERSQSRKLTRDFVEAFALTHPGLTVTYRDAGHDLIPGVTEEWIAAAFTPEANRSKDQREVLRLSDTLVDELLAADTLVIGVPMYNFGIPAQLKAWIDQVVRAGRTFSSETMEGLANGKSAVLVVTAGGEYTDQSPSDFVVPYLRQVLAFIGITDVSVIRVGGHDQEAMIRTLESARRTMATLAAAA